MKTGYLAIIAVIAASACVQPIHEITFPGHGRQVYTFDSDIREALEVPINDPVSAKLAFDIATRVNIVFNGSSQEDNGFFRVVLINLAKIPIFYSYDGRALDFSYFYYLNETWFNETGEEIKKPALTETTVWLKGPSTGAVRTAVIVDGNRITIEGTSFENLKKAGDRLTLAVFGINSIRDISNINAPV